MSKTTIFLLTVGAVLVGIWVYTKISAKPGSSTADANAAKAVFGKSPALQQLAQVPGFGFLYDAPSTGQSDPITGASTVPGSIPGSVGYGVQGVN